MAITGMYRWDFQGKWGTGTPFSITDGGLIYGGKVYTYDRLSPITVISAPNALVAGTAQVTLDHEKVLSLSIRNDQHQAFLQAMAYANELIGRLSGNDVQRYKYLLQAENGAKAEIFDSYVVLYMGKGDLMSSFAMGKNAMDLSRTITLDALLGVQYQPPYNGMGGSISFLDQIMPYPDKQNTISVSPANANVAQTIAGYLNEQKATGLVPVQSDELPHLDFEIFEGQERTFTLDGNTLQIPVAFDALNTYRKHFQALGRQCADRFKQEYRKQIHDYKSFMECFHPIYEENMEPMLQYAMDALVAQGIWTITREEFLEVHQKDYFTAGVDHDNLLKAGIKTVETNLENNIKATSMPRMGRTITIGKFSNALGNMFKKEAYNAVADYVSKKAVENTSLSTAQQWELYNRLNLKNITERVFCDYSNMWITLVNVLKADGHQLIGRMRPKNERYASLFSNLSNPHFPKDKIAPALLEMIQATPYQKPYYAFMQSHFGKTEEVMALCEYFGYGDLEAPYTL